MVALLYFLFVALGICSAGIFAWAPSSVQEIMAGVVLLSSLVCLVGAGILQRLGNIADSIDRADQNNFEVNHAIWKQAAAPTDEVSAPIRKER